MCKKWAGEIKKTLDKLKKGFCAAGIYEVITGEKVDFMRVLGLRWGDRKMLDWTCGIDFPDIVFAPAAPLFKSFFHPPIIFIWQQNNNLVVR